ncbi:histidine phosphatase family protein [Aquisalimonas asiatica]|uniref:Broad specificity phosphatase PhoE n=1 Tax=Aquisalimonas asiatica TaxID=406100 RepID=A0A1H8RH92_9GAMM|nr:histidine phosphatase family protein [Aquisalimonas asiatica]SEO65765.1 Broad specificity phosphatase PhoE [Aquisalimonas asiatica]
MTTPRAFGFHADYGDRAALILLLAVILLSLPPLLVAEERDEALALVREGEAVLMLRHALAPGVGDPEGFEVGDCSTQRNLDERGREQARAWKPFLQAHGIDRARVLSSQWCRSMDTAQEMNVGEVVELPPLNSFFGGRGDREQQTRDTIMHVNTMEPGDPVILVSHQVNITALTGTSVRSNEGVIIRLPPEQRSEVVARIAPDAE